MREIQWCIWYFFVVLTITFFWWPAWCYFSKKHSCKIFTNCCLYTFHLFHLTYMMLRLLFFYTKNKYRYLANSGNIVFWGDEKYIHKSCEYGYVPLHSGQKWAIFPTLWFKPTTYWSNQEVPGSKTDRGNIFGFKKSNFSHCVVYQKILHAQLHLEGFEMGGKKWYKLLNVHF